MAETGAAADIEIIPTRGLTGGQRVKAIMGGSAGNLVEWYDWFAYTGFSIYFASQFFPSGDNTAQLLKAALLNVVSFGARPIGAWAMGYFADRYGRRTALVVSVLMMCLGALIIACAPTYAQIGAIAPFVLVGARILQGLSVGGQYGAAATYMSEMASKGRRGFWSSFQYVTLIAGQLLALMVLIVLRSFMSKQELTDGGWRIAFFIGAGLAVLVFFVQWSLEESHSYKNAKAAGEVQGGAFSNLALLFTKYWKETAIIMGLTAAGTSGFYAYTTYMLKFLQNTAHFTDKVASNINFFVLVAFMLAQPLIGWISDKIGRKPLLMMAFGGGALLTWPVMTTVAAATSPVAVFFILMGAMLVQAGYTAINAVVKAELYPSQVRTLGVALPYALANATFGGTAEYVALWFKSIGMESSFYIYASVIMALGFLVVLFMPDTRRHSRILED